MTQPQRIELKEALEALRLELSESILVSEGKQVRFKVPEIEMEFQVTIEKSADAKAAAKFWVMEVGAGGTVKSSTTHKLKIKIEPIYKDGSPVLTGDDEKRA
jgi:predicted RNase H-like nuclease (RuvC/YqgF family)